MKSPEEIERRKRSFLSRFSQLVGFDVMFDDHGKAWLLEVNNSPSLRVDYPVDEEVKSRVMSDYFAVLRHDLLREDRGDEKDDDESLSLGGFHPIDFSEVESDPDFAPFLDEAVVDQYIRCCGHANRLRGLGATGFRQLMKEFAPDTSAVDVDLEFIRLTRGDHDTRLLSIGEVLDILKRKGLLG